VKTANLIIHNAGQLVTCAAGGKPKRGAAMLDVGIVEDGAVAVANGKIVGVGSSLDVLREFSTDEIVDAGGRVASVSTADGRTFVTTDAGASWISR